MAREIINGRVFVNGYATDEAGRPRTVSNGYTDEDERDAKEDYELEKASLEKNNLKQNEVTLTQTKIKQDEQTKNKPRKYKIRKDLQFGRVPNDLRGKKTYSVNGELWDVEYIDNHYFVGGYATNEMGQPICAETGYDDEAVLQSIKLYKAAKASKQFNL